MVSGSRPTMPLEIGHLPEMLADILKKESLKGFPKTVATKVPSGRIWPHDEFSYGYRPLMTDGGDCHENPLRVSDRAEQAIREDWALARFPLDLSDASNSTNPPKRGLKGITGYGRNMVKAVGALMNKQYPHHRVTFCTLTLPVMSAEQRRRTVEQWSDLTRELLRWLSRRIEGAGVPPVVCSVTEIQPKRLNKSGEGYLHWHLIWLNRPAHHGSWSINPVELSEWLHSILSRRLAAPALGRVNCDVKPVRGEVASYMAKYMSKGSEVLAEAQADWGEELCPSTWWNMTAPTRKWVKSNVLHGDDVGSALEDLVYWCRENGEMERFPFLRAIELELDGAVFVVGWRGRLDPEDAIALRGMLQSVHMNGFSE